MERQKRPKRHTYEKAKNKKTTKVKQTKQKT